MEDQLDILASRILQGTKNTVKEQLLFHGSYMRVDRPKIIKHKYSKDFGTAFYCTEYETQAVRWALKYGKDACVNSYRYKEASVLTIKTFENVNDDWLDFVVNCRLNRQHDYDIVIGPMADDRIYASVLDFISGRISRSVFFAMAEFTYPTHQIAFCSEESLECLTFVGSRGVK